MFQGNREHYGYRHRADPEHEVGDSMPGKVGDISIGDQPAIPFREAID